MSMRGTIRPAVESNRYVKTTAEEMLKGTYREGPIATARKKPTYMGESFDIGEVHVGAEKDEGYAIIQCGNSRVKVGYSLLNNIMLHIDSDSIHSGDLSELQKRLYSITCEAGLGRTGEGEFNPDRDWEDAAYCSDCGCWYKCVCADKEKA